MRVGCKAWSNNFFNAQFYICPDNEYAYCGGTGDYYGCARGCKVIASWHLESQTVILPSEEKQL